MKKKRILSTVLYSTVCLFFNCSFKYYESNFSSDKKKIEIKYFKNKNIRLINGLKLEDKKYDGEPYYVKEDERRNLDKVIRKVASNFETIGIQTKIEEDTKTNISSPDSCFKFNVHLSRDKSRRNSLMYDYVNPVLLIGSLGLIPIYAQTTYTYQFIVETSQKRKFISDRYFIKISIWEGWVPFFIAKIGGAEEWQGNRHFHREKEVNFIDELSIEIFQYIDSKKADFDC